jgi:ABC-type nitrate/sulfonate/bicarbonate transport system substrate-binding protein
VAGLQVLGLKPDDIKIVEVGGQSTRIAALQSGSIALAPADPFNAPTLEQAGYVPIVKLNETDKVFAGSNIEVQKAWAEKYPNTALAIAAASLVAQQTEFTDTKWVSEQYAKFAKLPQTEASQAIDQYLKSGICQRDLRSTQEAYENDRDVLESINPDVKDVDAFSAYEPKFLDKLASMEFVVKQ